jgi:uncharacterized protein (DUF1697 family)
VRFRRDDLKSATDANIDDVQTLLQSGNAVLTAKGPPERVALDLEHHIATDLGVTATARNWSTVTKLLIMVHDGWTQYS